MKIEEAIKKAIEQGFKNYPSTWDLNDFFVATYDAECQIFLDPSFWQSLGKALGWRGRIVARKPYLVPLVKEDAQHELHLEEVNHGLTAYPEWHWKMHEFIDHLAEGKDAESFFAAFN
jgi:hypothetical protein